MRILAIHTRILLQSTNNKAGGPGFDGWYAMIDLKTQKTIKTGTVNGSGNFDGIGGIQFHNNDLILAGNSNSLKDTIDKELIIDHPIVASGQDAFLTKFSLPCDCIMAPIASFDYSAGKFTFTGTSGADSVTWDFGDGGKAKGTTVTHGYSTKGKYTVCVTVWTKDCGKVKSCKEIDVTVSITDIRTTEGFVKIYPNPANDIVTIDGLQIATEIKMYSIVGKQVINTIAKSGKTEIDISDLSDGLYLIQLKDSEGNLYSSKITKQ